MMKIPCSRIEESSNVKVDYRGIKWVGHVDNSAIGDGGDGDFYLTGETIGIDEDYVYVKIKKGDDFFETLKVPNYTGMDIFYV